MERKIKSFKSTGPWMRQLGKPRPILDKDGLEAKAEFKADAFWKTPKRGIGDLRELFDKRAKDNK